MSEVEDKYGIITHIYVSGKDNTPQPQAKTEIRQPNADGLIYLNEIPCERYRMTITNKKTMTEVFSLEEVVDKYKYYVDYNKGVLYTDPSLYGNKLELFYMSIGYLRINASRIMWNNNMGTDKNLEKLFLNVQEGLTYLEEVGEANDLLTSLNNANTTAQNLYASLNPLNNSASENLTKLTSINNTSTQLKNYFGDVDTDGTALNTANNLKTDLTTLTTKGDKLVEDLDKINTLIVDNGGNYSINGLYNLKFVNSEGVEKGHFEITRYHGGESNQCDALALVSPKNSPVTFTYEIDETQGGNTVITRYSYLYLDKYNALDRGKGNYGDNGTIRPYYPIEIVRKTIFDAETRFDSSMNVNNIKIADGSSLYFNCKEGDSGVLTLPTASGGSLSYIKYDVDNNTLIIKAPKVKIEGNLEYTGTCTQTT